MKYYSEKLNKIFENQEDCVKAEEEHEAKLREEEEKKVQLANERKARAKEVEAAAEAVSEARKHYNELLTAFIKDYGSYHLTLSSNGNFFDWLKDFWF